MKNLCIDIFEKIINFKKRRKGYNKIKRKNLKIKKNKRPFIPIFILIPLLLVLILIILTIIFFFLQIFNYIFKKKFTRIIYTREEALTRGRNYLNICLEGKLINQKKITPSKHPKITVIIPIYNGAKYIKSTLLSVQNQKMTDFEIILVDDFSTDNSSLIIEELKKGDPRIKSIKNEKNMGILYSRCIGVLEAKGKYILNLDHDDFFLDDDVFEVLYGEAENGNFDIISYMEVEIRDLYANIDEMNDGMLTHHKEEGLIVKQPQLPYYPFFKNESFDFVDIQIWGKMFKTEVYKKAVNLLGKERYSVYNAINEDNIGVFAICIVAENYKYVRKYGLFHRIGHGSAIQRYSEDHRKKMMIFFIDITFDLSKNEYKKYAVFMAKSFDLDYLNEENKEYLNKVLKKIINCEYIEERYKEIIKNKYKDIFY